MYLYHTWYSWMFSRNTCRDVAREKRNLYRGVAPERAVDYGVSLWFLYF